MPSAFGQRRRKVFDLARYLKFHPGFMEADEGLLRRIVEEWHCRALPNIRTKGFEETWKDFLNGYDLAECPIGGETVVELYKEALAEPYPEVARNYRSPTMRNLVALCCKLHRVAGGEPFRLDCRTAGRLVQVPHKMAWSLLGKLERDGVIETIKKGTPGRATRYRYVSDVPKEQSQQQAA